MRYRLQKKNISARLKKLNVLIGATVCALLAGLALLLFNPFHFKTLLPFAFIGVLMLVSQRFGAAAGLLGGIATAMIFAYFSPPVASIRVTDAALRTNLSWMLLLGIPAGYFVSDEAASRSTPPKYPERH
jgi:K+-sensing histidine kinase KdpD